MKKFILTIVFLFISSLSFAQTVTDTLVWDQLNETVANTATYVYTYKLDTAAATVITPTCAAVTTNVHCTVLIPTLTSGNHTILVNATNPSAVTVTGTLNYVPGAAPGVFTNITITIKITVP